MHALVGEHAYRVSTGRQTFRVLDLDAINTELNINISNSNKHFKHTLTRCT